MDSNLNDQPVLITQPIYVPSQQETVYVQQLPPNPNMVSADGNLVYVQQLPPNPNMVSADGNLVYVQQGYPQPQPMVNPQMIYVTTTTNTTTMKFTQTSVEVICPSCKEIGFTVVNSEAGSGTWVVCLAVAIFGGCLCSLIPFCIDDCQDKVHTCSKCGFTVGRKKFLFE